MLFIDNCEAISNQENSKQNLLTHDDRELKG